MFCRLKGCTKCGGDLIPDEDDWKCMQCAQYDYARPAGRNENSLSLEPELTADAELDFDLAFWDSSMNGTEHATRKRGTGSGAREARNINSLVQAKITCEERWWARNRQIIEYLDQGLSVREISNLTLQGPRQVRTVRERLADFRVEALEVE